MTTQEIQAHIKAHAPEEARRAALFEYYRKKHAIDSRTRSDPSKPNNKLRHDYPKVISGAFTGYVFGEPVSYNADDVLGAYLTDTLKYNDEQAENSALGLDCSICGYAFEILYIDADAEVRFKRVDPVRCIAIYDSTIEEALQALIRYYDVRDVVLDKVTRYVEVYDTESKTVYTTSTNGGSLTLDEEMRHGFRDVPVVVYKNNMDAQGDFEGVISLIDAYDKVQSDSVNDFEYFADAYLALIGMGGTQPEDIAKMKEDRVLSLPTDADAKWLIKEQNDTQIENLKTRLNNDIYRFSGCPDMSDENFLGNSSGVAMKYKLLQYENLAGNKEREFKRGLQRRIELLCNVWETLGRGHFDWRDVQITFKRALPENLLELTQALSNLGSLISDETKRTMLPIEIDEATERARIDAEKEAGLSLFRIPEMITPEEMSEDA